MPQPQSPPGSAADIAADRTASAVAAALGRIPSGLFIVTWRDGGRDRGMLASWVMQAGFTPPMITVAVAPERDLLGAIAAGTPFVVNVLAEHQRPLLARFGKPPTPGEDPFAGLVFGPSPCGAPVLGESAAWIEGESVAQTRGSAAIPSDHVVVLARVNAAGAAADVPPLVHLRKNGLRY